MKRTDSHSSLFLWLTVFFISSLLLSNIIAGKLITVFGIVLPSAVILFPLTYVMGDVFTEVYGFRKARVVIWAGFAANLLMSIVFIAAVALPSPSFFTAQSAYAAVLGFAPRVAAASLAGYLAGEFANSIILSALKKATKGRFLWIRTIGSTVVGQGIDTVLFIVIAFAGTIPAQVLLTMVLFQYLFKVAYEAILTPATYFVVAKIKKAEGVDTYDYHEHYNPFSIKE
jgi:uncharacterized integral membrane protein (TIGR00697 family)